MKKTARVFVNKASLLEEKSFFGPVSNIFVCYGNLILFFMYLIFFSGFLGKLLD